MYAVPSAITAPVSSVEPSPPGHELRDQAMAPVVAESAYSVESVETSTLPEP